MFDSIYEQHSMHTAITKRTGKQRKRHSTGRNRPGTFVNGNNIIVVRTLLLLLRVYEQSISIS